MNFWLFGFTAIRASELQELRERLATAEAAAARTATIQGDLEKLRARLAAEAATAAANALQAKAPPPADSRPTPPRDPADGPPAAVQEVIRLADGLLDLTGNGEVSAGTVLRWVEARTKALLAACDVKRIEESGPFDPSRQRAEASREAPSPELADQIADTVRPGYAWHGAVLRPQHVVVYVPANK